MTTAFYLFVLITKGKTKRFVSLLFPLFDVFDVTTITDCIKASTTLKNRLRYNVIGVFSHVDYIESIR